MMQEQTYYKLSKGEIIMENKTLTGRKVLFAGKCKGKDLVEAMVAAAKEAGLKDNRPKGMK